MKHIVKTVSRFLLLSLTLGCGFFAFNQNNRSITPNYADGDSSSQKRTYTAADFAGELQADPEELEVSLVQNTTTSTSQSLNFAFKSKTLVGYSNATKDFVINISDPAFTGDLSNPVGDDFDNFDEETGLPIFDGELLYILGSFRGNSDDFFVPSTLEYSETFIISVSSIASDCVTADGAQYNGKNTWYKEGGTKLKYHKIHIPTTIATIGSGAFTGVPSDVTIAYEGSSIPEGFATDWTDCPSSQITLGSYDGSDARKSQSVGTKIDDIVDEHGRPVDFCLGCNSVKGSKYEGEQYDRPLVIEFNVVKQSNPSEVVRTVFDELPLANTNDSAYDSVGNISALSYSRLLGYKLGADEIIDPHSIVFHNIMKFIKGAGASIDTSVQYYAKPSKFPELMDLSKLVSIKATSNSTFAGFSRFSLSMDKNLDITSEKYPEPHSLYLDVKSDFYEQNKTKILAGLTDIRYSIYNLYLSSYHFVYEGRGREIKDFTIGISSPISYQTLDTDKNNSISLLVSHEDIRKRGQEIGMDLSDFSADKVKTFELVNLTIQMDLLTTSDSGSRAVLAKSQVNYKFAYVTVRDNEKLNVFNWNIFLIIFLVGYVVLFAAGSFILYRYKKEKYKNDEFRRVNDKKYLKSAILYGLGFAVIAYAIIFITMRAVGFSNTIVSFNPTDPLLIAFAVAGMIIGGYFIVLAIKAVKAEQERRKAIRLRLNEDVEDDGTK